MINLDLFEKYENKVESGSELIIDVKAGKLQSNKIDDSIVYITSFLQTYKMYIIFK